MESLKKAWELFENFDFSKYTDVRGTGTYTIDNGNLTCSVILKNDDIEVLNCIALPGLKVPMHIHKQTEHYLLYEGKAKIVTPSGAIYLSKLDSPHIDPGVPHSLQTETGCKLLIARIPPITDGGY